MAGTDRGETPEQSGFLTRLVRGVVVVAVDTATLFILDAILPGFDLADAEAGVAVALLVALLNAFVLPTLSRLALPLSVLTLGLASLLLNVGMLALAVYVVDGAELSGPWAAVAVAVGLSTITALLSGLLAIDDEDSFRRNVVRRQAKRAGGGGETEVPGVIFLEIDGLAHEVLLRAMRDGNAPTLARWLRSGSHRLECWETDWSSQTGACQAGLLHGNNDDMPAFRWWEKDRGKAIVTNHPRDAALLEERHSDGRGLLHAGGGSRANILSGDATHSMLTMSTVLRRRRPIGKDYSAYFAMPYAVIRTLVRVIADIAAERRAAARQRRTDVRPRIERSRTYSLMRAFGTVIQLDLQIATVIGDMFNGIPVVYTTFLAYDEVAHHSGIERHDTLAILRQVDKQLARIEATAQATARPYELVVLSDHGQSQGDTFLTRYEQTLEDLVAEACAATDVQSDAGDDDALSYLGAGLTEVGRDDTVAGRAVRVATRKRSEEGVVQLKEGEGTGLPVGDELPELSVMASGNLGIVSFPREPGRVTRERLDELHPRLLPALCDHPGVGFVLVRSETDGGIVLGAGGSHRLSDGRVEGEDPLAPFGPNAAAKVARTDGFAHCPDLVINGTWWAEMAEVAAFEELVGSHGGMGGSQSFPFVLHPAHLTWPDEDVLGAERVHRILCGWLAQLGQEAYEGKDTDPPGSSTRTSTSGASSAS